MRPTCTVSSLGCGGWLAAVAQRLVNPRTLSPRTPPGLGHSQLRRHLGWKLQGPLRSHPAAAAFCLSTVSSAEKGSTEFCMRVFREDAPHGPAPPWGDGSRERAPGSACRSDGSLPGVQAPSLLRALSSCTAFLPQSEPRLILFPGHGPSVSPVGSSLSTINLPATGRREGAGWRELGGGGAFCTFRGTKINCQS